MSIIPEDIIDQIKFIRSRCTEIKPLLAIQCLTYNHNPFLKDTLNGFISQKTNFPFVAIVHEDASTDNTAQILKEYMDKYPDIILPIFEKENQYSKRGAPLIEIIRQALRATGAKYIAICEGDDYWTNPHKLQEQVNYLESHPDYSLCYTKVSRYNQSSKTIEDEFGGPTESFESLLIQNTIPTLSCLILAQDFFDYYLQIEPAKRNWLMGDYPMWLYIAAKKKIKFININTGVYRILENSASHSRNLSRNLKFHISYREIALFFAEKFNSSNKSIVKTDLLFWEFAQEAVIEQKAKLKDKLHIFKILSNNKRKLAILLSLLSNKLFVKVIARKFK